MYDLAPPTARYAEEGANLRALSRQEDSKYIAADRSSDRAKRLTAGIHRQRRDKYNSYANLLAEELKEQSASRSFTIKRLAREKLHWFSHGEYSLIPGVIHAEELLVATKPALLISSIIEHCIQPRCLLSPMDADFCTQFIKALHLMGTPGFHTLAMYDKVSFRSAQHRQKVSYSATSFLVTTLKLSCSPAANTKPGTMVISS